MLYYVLVVYITKEDVIFIQEFIDYWNKNNKDKFYDEFDIKEALKNFYLIKKKIKVDLRKNEYRQIWLNISKYFKNLK